MKTGRTALLIAAISSFSLISAGEKYDPAWKKATAFLLKAQAEDGSWGRRMGKTGITACVLEALTLAPAASRTAAVKPALEKAAAYLVKHQQQDGSIVDGRAPRNYCTALAVMALCKFDRKKYAPQIAKATDWIKRQQHSVAAGAPNPNVGGIGYDSSARADLSNTWLALDALKAAGVPPDDPVWKAAARFVKRCQNSTEVNDLKQNVGDDGGAVYRPGESPAGERTLRDGRKVPLSYGSMTYAMMISYLWCDLKKDSQAVRIAAKWLARNWAVDRNPNAKQNGQQGLYYYYRVMSKSLAAYGEKKFAGRDWARELADAIVKRQREDGSWLNAKDRYEGDPLLVTAYSLTALATCQQALAGK